MSRIGKFPWGQRLGKASGGSSSAQFLVLASDGDLANERVLTAGTGIAFADAGAGSTLTISAMLSTGVASGQSAIGGTAASETLTLSSTAHATKGKILFGSSAYDEVNNRLGIATASPSAPLHVVGEILGTTKLTVGSTAVGALGVTGEFGSTTASDIWIALNAANGSYKQWLLYNAGVLKWDFGLIPTENTVRLREGTNGTTKLYANIGTEGEVQLVPSGGNLLVGTGTDVATSKVRIDASRSVASAAGAVWDGFDVMASTLTISGSTNITTATGVNLHTLKIPTLSAASALTVTNAATLYIAGAPAGGGAGPATITNAYSLWVDAGSVRYDGRVLRGKGADVATGGTLTLGGDGNYFETTGTTTVNYITTTGWTAGSQIWLRMGGDTTFNHNTASPPANTANLSMSGGANQLITQNDVVSFLYNGTKWLQSTGIVALST